MRSLSQSLRLIWHLACSMCRYRAWCGMRGIITHHFICVYDGYSESIYCYLHAAFGSGSSSVFCVWCVLTGGTDDTRSQATKQNYGTEPVAIVWAHKNIRTQRRPAASEGANWSDKHGRMVRIYKNIRVYVPPRRYFMTYPSRWSRAERERDRNCVHHHVRA